MKHRLSTVVATAAVGALLAGCGGGGPSSGGGKVSDDKIVLGVLTDLCSDTTDIAGPNSVQAVQMAVDDFKKKYGDKAITRNIEVIKADHQNKPEIADAQAREMYDRQEGRRALRRADLVGGPRGADRRRPGQEAVLQHRRRHHGTRGQDLQSVHL